MLKTTKSSALRRAVEALRNAALESEDGGLLGSEDELTQRFGISRPTLRQASALLSQEQLLTVRRGVGGGYFARRPESTAVAHMAAIYLRTHGARLDEIVRAVEPIRIEVSRLAARNRDPALTKAMKDFVATERQLGEDLDYRVFLRQEREFGALLGQMGGNRVLSLFLQILYDFAGLLRRDQDIYVNRPDRVSQFRGDRNLMAEAIIIGDEEMAALAARRCSRAVSDWLIEDLRGNNTGAEEDYGATLAEAFRRNGAGSN